MPACDLPFVMCVTSGGRVVTPANYQGFRPLDGDRRHVPGAGAAVANMASQARPGLSKVEYRPQRQCGPLRQSAESRSKRYLGPLGLQDQNFVILAHNSCRYPHDPRRITATGPQVAAHFRLLLIRRPSCSPNSHSRPTSLSPAARPPGFPQGAFRSRRSERGCAPSQTLHACRGQATHTSRLNLHDTAGPARRRDDHYKTTSRRTTNQSPPYSPAARTVSHVASMTPGRPAARTPRRRQIAWPNTGRPCASPSPLLRSTSASACAAQARRLPIVAVCANVNTCRRRKASRYSAYQRRHRRALTTRRNLGPRHQCKFMLKKIFAPHTRRPLSTITPKYSARSPLHAAKSPLQCRNIEVPGLGVTTSGHGRGTHRS